MLSLSSTTSNSYHSPKIPQNYAYPTKLCEALNELRGQCQLCDIIINVGGRAFHAHKAVLAARSGYFLAMFTSGFKESTEREINIDGSRECFDILLEFAYTGRLKVTQKTAYDVLDMACYMQFVDVYQICSTFITTHYTSKTDKIFVGDAFKASMLSRNHVYLAQLLKASEKYMQDNVQELKRTDVFLQNASVVFLKEFLSHEELSSASEEKQVLEMVVNWLKYNWANRRNSAYRLLRKVRLGFVPAEHLQMLIDADILEIPECKDLLYAVLQQQISKKSPTTLSLQIPEFFSTRSTMTVPVSTYTGDSGLGLSTCKFQYYHAQRQCWKDLKRFATLPISGSSKSMVVVKGTLFAAGGLEQELDPDMLYHDSDSDSDLDFDFEDHCHFVSVCQTNFYRYLAAENIWTKLPPMNQARTSFPLVYLDGFVYAIAGSTETGAVMRHVERYNMAEKQWEVIPPLPEANRRISATAFKGKILVYGELSLLSGTNVLKYALQVYHPDTNTWQSALYEEYDEARSSQLFLKPPSLFVHKDICYRVLYQKPTENPKWYWDTVSRPTVNILKFEFQNGSVSVMVGEVVTQDHIPDNWMCAFRIQDEVFVNERGFIHNTGIRIAPDQSTDVNLQQWESFCNVSEQGNIIRFTFDRKRLEN